MRNLVLNFQTLTIKIEYLIGINGIRQNGIFKRL